MTTPENAGREQGEIRLPWHMPLCPNWKEGPCRICGWTVDKAEEMPEFGVMDLALKLRNAESRLSAAQAENERLTRVADELRRRGDTNAQACRTYRAERDALAQKLAAAEALLRKAYSACRINSDWSPHIGDEIGAYLADHDALTETKGETTDE